jgi:oxygen-dependent protoporphyrinogen oxidase
MRSVAVVGAGIAGLTAAFTLKRRGIPVRVYEATGRVGGVIRSTLRDGYLAESGPNTILETSPAIARLVEEAGLASRRIDPDPRSETRFVVRGGRPVPVPSSPLGMVTTPLLSLGAKLAVLREPFVSPRRDGAEESVAEFVTRRLGREFVDRMVDALVAGIYAGDPEELSLTHAFPRMKALEDEYGSLLRGQIFGAGKRRKSGEVAKDRAPKFSFDAGLQVLPDTLAGHLGNAIVLNTPVASIARSGSGWKPAPGEEHAAVILCGTAPGMAGMSVDGVSLAPLAEIRYPPVASVVLGFRREDVAHPCAGFGMLIPRLEGFRILGAIFSSSLFPARAPAGHLTLTCYVGGERQPELASRSEDELYGIVAGDLRALLGATGTPTFASCAFYPRAIPQYNVGYGRFKDLMADVERRAPGVFFAGHAVDGVSLGDSIASGVRAADRAAAWRDSS